MFKFQADLSKLLNRYINQQHVFGQNDCNILVAEYIDLVCATEYTDKLKDKYTSIPEGLKICKDLTGFNNVLEACETHLEKSETIETGSVILIKKKHKNRIYYVASIVFNNRALVEHENKYQLINVNDFNFELIFNRRK
ncbi:hypothetical protein L2106_07700 [Citrobacter portucalensis]|jgi:hypothetical protein|uniref:DUF6950 family protein n=1 Tax=Enterobacteriaceae TaxID=543 RepID=UPI000F6863F3|nr:MULTISPECIES: hypothetical protein [Enterobacteriaceae]HEE0086167.1 hypothetical protein [Citrobacter freundii]EHW5784799.1 hypothetical protein [Escherichia coli]KAA0557770.1 hypothetical protein F0329_05230 [Citrobacter werkmanii]MBD0820015.1 hypothetical protein [Citrobacter sp. C5_2]MBJ8373352.1 hypothetical protein [Citrobacter cronae]